MTGSHHPPRPVSPVLFADLALRPLPPALLHPILFAAMAVMKHRHPDVFQRLQSLEGRNILIDPVDLPLRFLLRPETAPPSLLALGENDDAGQPAATIRGPLLVLIDLLEGRLDGDALFFSRDLVIEGNTEAVLTLRNAVDSGEIDVLEDFLAPLGPLRRPVRKGFSLAGALLARAADDLETLRAAALVPLVRSQNFQAAELREIERKVAGLRRKTRGGRARRGAAESAIGEP